MPKSMILGTGESVLFDDDDIGRFEITVDDTLLVGMLDSPTHLLEQFQPHRQRELVIIAVGGDGDPAHEFHHEIETTTLSGAGIEYVCDVGMVHQGEGLALTLETGQ